MIEEAQENVRRYVTGDVEHELPDPPMDSLRLLGEWRRYIDPYGRNAATRGFYTLVNLGSATCPFWPKGTAGGVNIDIIATGHEDVRADATILPFPDGSLAGIYAHHILEHIRRPQAGAVVEEWRRALKTNGFLSVVVPDWRKLMISNIDLTSIDERDKILFGIDDTRGPYQPHQAAYSAEEVVGLLESVGFRDARCVSPEVYIPLIARPRWQSCIWVRK